jgi:hypothetical protein
MLAQQLILPACIWYLDTTRVGNGAATWRRWAAASSGGSRVVGAGAVDLVAGDLVRIQQPRARGCQDGRGRCCTGRDYGRGGCQRAEAVRSCPALVSRGSPGRCRWPARHTRLLLVITTAALRDATGWDELVDDLGAGPVRHGLQHTALTWIADAASSCTFSSTWPAIKTRR